MDDIRMNSNIETLMQEFFSNFPPEARVWLYQASTPFPAQAADELQPAFDAFATQWTAHNKQLKAEIHLIQNYFIVIMVDDDYEKPGGCSIDSSVHFIKSVGEQYGIELLDRMRVSYLHDGEIQNCAVNEFVKRYREKEFSPETVVINTLVKNKEELFSNFMIPLRESWLKKYL